MKNEIGGWCLHRKIHPKNGAEFNLSCDVCNTKFVAVYQGENSYLRTGNVFLDIDTAEVRKKVFTTIKKDTYSFEEVTVLLSVCPNCGNTKEIGCIPTGVVNERYECIETDGGFL